MNTRNDRLEQALHAYASYTQTPPRISLAATRQLAQAFRLSPREIEIAALEAHILPERYHRNHGTLSWEGQIALLRATVAVVGAGGLGGWVIEALARMGIGHLIIIDGDVFEENNLNRQLGCTEATLGRSKAHVMAERVAAVNGAVQVTPHATWLTAENAAALLQGVHVIVDALDTLPMRFILQRAARQLAIPLVHGAIAGYTGQVMTILPGDIGLEALYGEEPPLERGIETHLGNPAATPMMVASWQVQQCVKIIAGPQEGLLRNRLLLMDAQSGDITIIRLA